MQKEVDLRSYLEVLWKNRKLIYIMMIISGIMSYVYNFHIRKPIYQAETMLLTSPTEKQAQLQTGEMKDVVGDITQTPAMSLEAYEVALTSPELLKKTIQDLKLDMSVNALQGRISTRIIEKTNYIAVKVKDEDPMRAAKIANTLGSNFSSYVSQTIQLQAEKAANIILEQMNEEKSQLEQVSKRLSDVTAETRNLDELIAERKAKLDQVTLYKTMEKDLALTIVTDYETLKEIDKGLVKNITIPENIVIKMPLISGKVDTSENIQKIDQDTKEQKAGKSEETAVQGAKTPEQGADNNLVVETITPKLEEQAKSKVIVKPQKSVLDQIEIAYQPKANAKSFVGMQTANLQVELVSSIEKLKGLQTQIAVLKAELEDLTGEIAQKQYRYDIINREVALAKETFEAYQEKYKETLIKQSSQIGQLSISVFSSAQVPASPSGPGKILGFLLSLFFAAALGVGIVFLKNYHEVYLKHETK